MLKSIAGFILKSLGWKLVDIKPELKKYVAIGAPHTSNWDFPVGLLCLSALGLRFNWAGKDALFVGPLKYIFKAIGGIPVNRKSPKTFLKDITKHFNEHENMILAIAPEGTRSKTSFWKPGFYYIAREANVPIALCFVDFATKTTGMGEILYPTGDLEKDFEVIKKFYENKKGKRPEKQSDLKIRSSKSIDSKQK